MLRPCLRVYLGSTKFLVAHVVGYIKGKSAIHIARTFGGRTRNLPVRSLGQVAILHQP
jgi:hypothetical protein